MTGEGCLQLPRVLDRVKAPPIKCQGIKTRLAGFIAGSVRWDGKGRWIEPFLGSGAVLLNLRPERALVSDSNVHIIRFYNDLKSGALTPEKVSYFLHEEGEALRRKGEAHFYDIRERFNRAPSSLDFLFLTRACFNGVMRFNRSGGFNVPFCRKPDRFRQAYVTKIVNQVAWARSVITGRDWEFSAADWREALGRSGPDDFVYADPPYSGRHTDYYSRWTDEESESLVEGLFGLPGGFALSTWLGNRHRSNPLLGRMRMEAVAVRTRAHFYHVGSKEEYRNRMIEALVIDAAHASD